MASSRGRLAYAADIAARPLYHDGTPRKTWEQLGDAERQTWERNPTPRWKVTTRNREAAHA